LFVITQTKHPGLAYQPKDKPNCTRNNGKQANRDDGVDEDHEVNPMPEENDDIDIIENDRIHILIQDTFSLMDDNFDDVHDVPLTDKARKPLYEGSRTHILFDSLLLVKLKVLSGFSNTYLTQILRYAI
jgi:hypothetical protein